MGARRLNVSSRSRPHARRGGGARRLREAPGSGSPVPLSAAGGAVRAPRATSATARRAPPARRGRGRDSRAAVERGAEVVPPLALHLPQVHPHPRPQRPTAPPDGAAGRPRGPRRAGPPPPGPPRPAPGPPARWPHPPSLIAPRAATRPGGASCYAGGGSGGRPAEPRDQRPAARLAPEGHPPAGGEVHHAPARGRHQPPGRDRPAAHARSPAVLASTIGASVPAGRLAVMTFRHDGPAAPGVGDSSPSSVPPRGGR